MIVCVPARNEAALLPRLLSAIAKQSVDGNGLHLCLYLDDCRDGSMAMLDGMRAALPFGLTLSQGPMDTEPNAGAARRAALAMGLERLAGGEGLLFTTDADSMPHRDWIAAGRGPCKRQMWWLGVSFASMPPAIPGSAASSAITIGSTNIDALSTGCHGRRGIRIISAVAPTSRSTPLPIARSAGSCRCRPAKMPGFSMTRRGPVFASAATVRWRSTHPLGATDGRDGGWPMCCGRWIKANCHPWPTRVDRHGNGTHRRLRDAASR